jgi:hypothetical protein
VVPLLSAESLLTLGTLGGFGGGETIDEAAAMKHWKPPKAPEMRQTL